jgi:hypothetical protein
MNKRNWMYGMAMAAALAAAPGAVHAQTPADRGGQVRGVVSDPLGAPVGEAEVRLRDESRRLWIALSDAQGKYLLQDVPPGAYTITMSYPGFKDASAPVQVEAGRSASVAASLKIAYSESIEVRQSLSDPAHNPSTVILSSRDVERLPGDETLFLERLAQLAGAARVEDLALYVDGFQEYKRIPPRGTVDVIRINSNPFSAEFAGKSARRVEITTKPGADIFHGSARLQFRNNRLNARAPGEPALAPMKYNNTNGYLQGPLAKGRAGFLVYAGVWEQGESSTIRTTLVDPVSYRIDSYTASAASPLVQKSLLAKVDFTLFNQRMNATFMRNTGRHRNQGLEGGFALPEHAYETATAEDVGRLWWASIGRRSVNDARLQVSRSRLQLTPRTTAPEVIVLNAFTAGGNQEMAASRSSLAVQAADTFLFQAGRHLFKGGVQIDAALRTSADRAGFGGSFTFGAGVERDAAGRVILDASGQPIVISPIESYRRTLVGLPGYGPTQFAIVRGNPDLRVSQWSAGVFLLDDWTISRKFSLSWGVRQEIQNHVTEQAALAPRAYVSWAVDAEAKTIVKAGAGLFYASVDPDLALQTQKLDGTHQEQLTVSNPAFFSEIPSLDTIPGAVSRTLYRSAEHLRQPGTWRTSAALERRLPGDLWVVAEYARDRGTNLLRSRWLSGTPRTFQFESGGRSSQHSMLLALRGHVGRSTFFANYTLARAQGDTDGAFSVLTNSGNPSEDYGTLATSRRHVTAAGATLVLPRDVYITPAVTFASGLPFDITTGIDNNGDTLFNDRPAFAQAGEPGAVETPYGWLTPTPRPGDAIVPRNLGREASQATFNLSAAKMFKSGLAFTLDVSNVMNRSRPVGTSGVLTSPVFGVANRSLSGRRVELGARFDF